MTDRKDTERKETEMFIAGLMTEASSNAPVLILRDEEGKIGLPIWIGVPEATAIASAIKQIPFPRPMTHDLLRNSIEELGGSVHRIVINDLRDHTFFASIEVRSGESLHVIDARPSDALALAVRVGAKIFVSQRVLAEAQIQLVEDQSTEDGAPVNQDFSGIDKDRWAELLSDMDPDDFKYKM